ncbi:glycosyltransferase family 2 protein [Flavobacterium sp.]|jgi:glycosyltransferase involved in cell wall biosynthesis|uniref:glycosyltransferase family 2 protein n=1 Tax=Flavobacterium sp. TaxID=239 RepID=UPI0037BF88E9
MNPLISVIIPVYNVSKYLKQCLDSIVNQTYKNLEIILVNDGSTDDSLKICEVYEQLDSRIVVISQANKGLAGARNTGIENAKGAYLMFVDSDDWMELYAIETAFSKMDEVDLVCFSFYKEYPSTQVARVFGLNGKFDAAFMQRRITGPIKEELSDPSHLETLVTAWGKIYKTAIIKENKIQAKNLSEIGAWEDGFFTWEYLNQSKSVYILDVPMYNYRKFNSESITSNYKNSLLDKTNHMFDLLSEQLKKHNKGTDYLEAFNNRICLSVIGLGLNESFNKASFFTQCKNMKTVLNSRYHKLAFRSLELRYFPIHWKLFFFFSKYKLTVPLLLLLLAIKKIIKK